MYTIRMTKTFRRDTERCRKCGYDMELLKTAIRLLEVNGEIVGGISCFVSTSLRAAAQGGAGLALCLILNIIF